MAVCDEHFLSHIGWEYKGFQAPNNTANNTCTGCGSGPWLPNGTANAALVGALARTYATAVAGRPVHVHFDPPSGNFTLVYEADPRVTAPTEIFVAETLHYKHGVRVTVSPASAAQWSHPRTNRIEVRLRGTHPTNITVTITPA